MMISKLFKSNKDKGLTKTELIKNNKKLSDALNSQIQKSTILSMRNLGLQERLKEVETELAMALEDYYDLIDDLIDKEEEEEDLEDLEMESEKFYEDYGTPPYYQDI